MIAPDLFAIECAYSLTKKPRQRLLAGARALGDAIMLDAAAFTPILPLMDRALDVSIQHRHDVYECLHVALAGENDVNLCSRTPD